MPRVQPYSSGGITVSIRLFLTDESHAQGEELPPFDLLAQLAGLDREHQARVETGND
jgi:hypothetical protein